MTSLHEKAERIEEQNELSTSTSIYASTTRYTTIRFRSWGFYDPHRRLLVERVEGNWFLYNLAGKIGLAELRFEPVEDHPKKKRAFVMIEGERYDPEGPRLWDVTRFYPVPSRAKISAFLAGGLLVRPLPDILNDISTRVRSLFEFSQERDVLLWLLFITQSYLKPILANFFFMGVDATKGGGKTTLLEVMSYLSRHGFVGGDVSAASLPRLVEELDLSLFLDELDQRLGKGEEDSVSIIRKGQRRGNPYVRLNKFSMVPEQFDVAGTHAFSYRSELEDAFMSRSISTHTTVSQDPALPVINIYKHEVLEDLRDELFFWYIRELPTLAQGLSAVTDRLKLAVQKYTAVAGCSDVAGCRSVSRHTHLRRTLYDTILREFTEEELHALDSLTGRNIELAFLLLQLSRLTGLNLHSVVGETLQEQQKDDISSDHILREEIRDFLANKYDGLTGLWVLKDGENSGRKYYPKSMIYREFNQDQKTRDAGAIGSKKFTGLLRDLGFVQGESITSQRPPGLTPRPCLIFTQTVLKGIGREEAVVSKDTMLQEIRTSQDVLAVLREMGEATPAELAKRCPEEDGLALVERGLAFYASRGDVFEFKTGWWKVT